MQDIANINLFGRVVRDPELKAIGTGNCCKFTVAVSTPVKNDDGSYESNFYECSLWGKQGESFAQYAHKGSIVCVNGDLAVTEYSKSDGTKRTSLRVNANHASIVPDAKPTHESSRSVDPYFG